MKLTDLVRDLSRLKKKYPQANVYLFGETNDLEQVQHIALAYAPQNIIQENKVTADDCVKQPLENYEPVIVIG